MLPPKVCEGVREMPSQFLFIPELAPVLEGWGGGGGWRGVEGGGGREGGGFKRAKRTTGKPAEKGGKNPSGLAGSSTMWSARFP